jgi:hypothetical protein
MAYRRSTSRDVRPRLTSWPLLVCCRLLLGGLLVAAALAWSVQVPAYVAASGLVLEDAHWPPALSEGPAAVLLVPPEDAGRCGSVSSFMLSWLRPASRWRAASRRWRRADRPGDGESDTGSRILWTGPPAPWPL